MKYKNILKTFGKGKSEPSEKTTASFSKNIVTSLGQSDSPQKSLSFQGRRSPVGGATWAWLPQLLIIIKRN